MPKATKRERQRQNRDARREAMLVAEKRRRRMRTLRTFGIIAVALAVLLGILTVTRSDEDDSASNASAVSAVKCNDRQPSTPVKTETYPAAPALTIDPAREYEVRMHTSCGDIPIVLDAKQAPQTVNSFLYLVQREFYNGTTFHRIVTDFVDQGGDPTGDGNGGPGYTLPEEPPADGYGAGDVAMAQGPDGNSGSQFFLIVSDEGAKGLGGPPYQYNILGHMTDAGLKVAKKINTFGSPDQAGTPTRDIYVFDIGIVFGDDPSATTTTAAP